MFFSVVIPVYNKEKEIRSTLETVLVQSFIDFEVVLVDDGSSDGSMEIVKGIKDSRIRLFSQKNQGVSAARNAGIRQAVGLISQQIARQPFCIQPTTGIFHPVQ